MHVDRSTGYLQRLLKRDLPLAATVGVSIVNGLDFSPVFDSVSFYLYGFARESPIYDGELFFYLTSVAISLMTLLLAGVIGTWMAEQARKRDEVVRESFTASVLAAVGSSAT